MFSLSPARVAFALAALLMPGAVAVAQDAPQPQNAALLPPAREVNGLQLRITDAGFGAPAPDESRGKESSSAFYFAYETTSANEKLDAEQLKAAVTLTRLFAPDGTPLSNMGYDSKRTYSREVSPAWKSVRAEFEVRDLSLPAVAATGRETTHYQSENIALPAMPVTQDQITTSAPDAIKFVTPRGTRLELVKLTREKQGERSEVAALWKWTAPPNTPGVSAEIEGMNVAYFGVQNGSVRALGENYEFTDPRKKVGEIEFHLNNVPAEAQTVDFAFDFTESALQWRLAAATQRVSFDIPVAALWKIAPLALRPPAVAAVKARNAEFEASWEMLEPNYANDTQVRLWLRDLAPAKNGEKWTLKGATLPENNGQTRNLFQSTQGWSSVFHTDNSLASTGESSTAFRLYRSENLGATADVTLTAQRALTLLKTHVLPLVPLPKRNDVVEFGPQEVFDGVWYLRRIVWIDDEQLKGDLRFSGGAGLLLTFDMAPGAYLDQDDMQLERAVFYDEKGTVSNSSSTFVDGDPAQPGHEKDRITMILSPPDASSQKFGGNFQIFQRVWSGPEKTLVVREVPLQAKSENPGAQN